jgi:hypothetical protein
MNFFEDVTVRSEEGDPAHSITMSKCGTHALKGTASDVPLSIQQCVVDDNLQTT